MKNKKWFTLIEMLIVIVIVGILAAALIPRLVWVQERARDTARRADLQQVGGAISTYELDNGQYPSDKDGAALAGSTRALTDVLSAYLKTMPNDPKNFNVTACGVEDGGYYFSPITKNGNENGAFVLVAAVEQAGAANYIGRDTCISDLSFEDIQSNLCEKVVDASAWANIDDENCVRTNGSDGQLRYVYLP